VVASRLTILIYLHQIFIAVELTDLKIRVFVGANYKVARCVVVINARFVNKGRYRKNVVSLKLDLREQASQPFFRN